MNTTNQPKKLSRAQLTQALDTVPLSHVLGKTVSRELTPKQRAFAVEVAKGSSGAAAYRKAYNTKSSPKIQGSEASKLKARPSIAQEIEAYKAAIDAETYRTPAGLRSLIIQSLVQTIIDPETPPAVRVQAAKVAGQITEVGLYTERKEVRTITSSETARAQVLEQLRTLVQGSAIDVAVIDRDADSLLAELADGGADGVDDSDAAETHPPATPHFDDEESLSCMHTIPDERFPSESIPLERPPSSTNPAASPQDAPQEDPPSGDWK
jgi:predicted outer membrane protein